MIERVPSGIEGLDELQTKKTIKEKKRISLLQTQKKKGKTWR